MDVITPQTWQSQQVAAWMSSIGFNNLEKKIIENEINGELLIHADHTLLKELSIKSVGIRLKILNSIYGLKLKYNVPIEDYDYIPKSIRMEMEKDIILNETKYKIIDNKYKESEQYISKLSGEVKKINEDLKQFKEDIKTLKVIMSNNMNKSELYKVTSSSNINLYALAGESENKNTETIKVYSALEKQECETLYKSLKLTSDDTTETFLTEVLKKYQIKNNITLYRLSINSDRYLENDEHPLEILQNFRAKGIEAQLFLRKINLKEEQKAKLNSVDLNAKSVSLNSIKEDTDKAYVLLAYKKKKDNEVSVEVGEVVEILNRESVDKYRVQKKGGIIGYLPTECIVEKEPGDEMLLYNSPMEGEIRKDYKKNNAYEISLKKGDKIKIHSKFRTWVYVESNKKQGWIPYTVVQLRRPRSLSSPLSQSRSLEDIAKLNELKSEENDKLQHFQVDFGSSSSLLNGRGNNSSNYINEMDENHKSFIMDNTNEKEKNIIGNFLYDAEKEGLKKYPHVPISNSIENLHSHLQYSPTSPGRNGLTLLKTGNMHIRSASSNDSLPSANSMLYAKFHLPVNSRKNSNESFSHGSEKEQNLSHSNSNTPLMQHRNIAGNYNENDADHNNNNKVNAYSKLNDLLSNFSPYDSEGENRKPSASSNKSNPKPY
ncbi:hypothetical protein BCR32DRAFT_296782 [Anaeromyces robustus]|uniref:SAM domain-containing protein n=1 Tax=Anaeromyces robustus TaxID=1754192 RepID=A0A1Y1WR68_9FUNG|nr:hypothetical protein BCR32DRAFT_296782 [Anaeromyces robustus]|eukprot:ORX75624.1 hypothetical protein BCR32DRAFT_296782 [Anaeromyces robustus]